MSELLGSKRRRLAVVALLTGAIALGAGVAYAAIPDSTGVIQGCYDSGGNLKVVSTLPCPKGWTPLSWNQKGTPGLNGSDGAPGTNGSNGSNGTNGTNGTNGVSGYQIVTDSMEFPAGTSAAGDFNVGCPGNKVAVGGGGRIFDSNFFEEPANFHVAQSFPGPQGHSWTIAYYMTDPAGLAFTMTVYAICVNAS